MDRVSGQGGGRFPKSCQTLPIQVNAPSLVSFTRQLIALVIRIFLAGKSLKNREESEHQGVQLNITELKQNVQLLGGEVISRVKCIAEAGTISEESRKYLIELCNDTLKHEVVEQVEYYENSDGSIGDLWFRPENCTRIESLRRERREGYIPFKVCEKDKSVPITLHLKDRPPVNARFLRTDSCSELSEGLSDSHDVTIVLEEDKLYDDLYENRHRIRRPVIGESSKVKKEEHEVSGKKVDLEYLERLVRESIDLYQEGKLFSDDDSQETRTVKILSAVMDRNDLKYVTPSEERTEKFRAKRNLRLAMLERMKNRQPIGSITQTRTEKFVGVLKREPSSNRDAKWWKNVDDNYFMNTQAGESSGKAGENLNASTRTRGPSFPSTFTQLLSLILTGGASINPSCILMCFSLTFSYRFAFTNFLISGFVRSSGSGISLSLSL